MNPQTVRLIDDILDYVEHGDIAFGFRTAATRSRGGSHDSSAHGASGREIVTIDEYEPFVDPVHIINWQATAFYNGQKTMVTRRYTVRPGRIHIIVDIGPTMAYGTKRGTKLRMAAEIAACIMVSASHMRDSISVLVYSDYQLEKTLEPTNASSMLMDGLALILEARPTQPKNSSASGLAEALAWLPDTPSRVFVISDFGNFSLQDQEALSKAAGVLQVTCAFLSDLRERELPKGRGLRTIQDMYGNRKTILLTDNSRHKFQARFQRQEQYLKQTMLAHFCDFLSIHTDENLTSKIVIHLLEGE